MHDQQQYGSCVDALCSDCSALKTAESTAMLWFVGFHESQFIGDEFGGLDNLALYTAASSNRQQARQQQDPQQQPTQQQARLHKNSIKQTGHQQEAPQQQQAP